MKKSRIENWKKERLIEIWKFVSLFENEEQLKKIKKKKKKKEGFID